MSPHALLLLAALAPRASALEVHVVDAAGAPLPTVMVTVAPSTPAPRDTSDHGYAPPDEVQATDRVLTAFTDADGAVRLDLPARQAGPWTVRLRRPGHVDVTLAADDPVATLAATLVVEADPLRRAEAWPANTWAGLVDLGAPELNRNFRMQCGFCHQQGLAPMRVDRPEQAWSDTIRRMIGYGSRLWTAAQEAAPARLRAAYRELVTHPETIPAPLPWDAALAGARYEEWALGDGMSQMHDMLVDDDGTVFVGDNTQDRLYAVDPAADTFRVSVMPREPDDQLGGMFAARLASFPKHQTYLSLHSLARSARDGHLFLTPSTQRRIVEFDPGARTFTVHPLDDGLYPHTIRIDARDRVWFTLALSNQVGMIDRATGAQRFVDLPARSLREAITIRAVPLLFKLAEWGLPLASIPIDELATGTPLAYGIDVTPDGVVWVARLHANDLARVDPDTFEVEMIPFPGHGPRRLRSDAEGNLWITAFGDGAVYRFEPATRRFEAFPLPTLPAGSETPYSLNVDKRRGIVWVTGTASDTLNALHVDTGTWSVFPLPRRLFFTRDIEVAPDGSVWSSNGAFPAWLVEGGQPTLVHVVPPWADGADGGAP